MTIEYGGFYQEQQSSFRELLQALLLAIVLVFITLLIEFRSFAHPISIVTGAVLALGGVLAGLFITGSTLNIVSLMGMIMVVALLPKNGILMLDAVEDHLAAGDTLREAASDPQGTAALSSCANDLAGGDFRYVAPRVGDWVRRRTFAAAGDSSNRWAGSRTSTFTGRDADCVCDVKPRNETLRSVAADG